MRLRPGSTTAAPGKQGWVPAVRGGWRKGMRHADRDYLPLTADVLAASPATACQQIQT
jgi:hypothetical protein